MARAPCQKKMPRALTPHWQRRTCTGALDFVNNRFLPKSKQNSVYMVRSRYHAVTE